MHLEDHFSGEGLLEGRFEKSSFSTRAELRISEQTMKTKIMQISGSPCYKELKVLRFKRTKMFVSFKATFHLQDFREK